MPFVADFFARLAATHASGVRAAREADVVRLVLASFPSHRRRADAVLDQRVDGLLHVELCSVRNRIGNANAEQSRNFLHRQRLVEVRAVGVHQQPVERIADVQMVDKQRLGRAVP